MLRNRQLTIPPSVMRNLNEEFKNIIKFAIYQNYLFIFYLCRTEYLKYYDLNITNKHILGKLIRKNRGNVKLLKAVNQLVEEIESSDWKTPLELTKVRPDADCVYGGEFYFFNINIHRTLILIEFEENGEATIVWAGNHDDYESIFKNNKSVIKKWLKNNNWIKK